jgi:hypothetical protein
MCIVRSFLEATLILLVDVVLFDKITAGFVHIVLAVFRKLPCILQMA